MNPLPGNTLDTIHIKDIRPGLKNFSITFIVLEVGQAVALKEGREVRTIKVADVSGCINLSLWDEPGAAISPGDIIRLNKAYATIWRNALTLYSAKNGDIDKVGEFCFVFNEQLNMSEPGLNFSNSIGNPMSGMVGTLNNNVNNGNTISLGGMPNRTVGPTPLMSVNDRNAPRYSGDRDRDRETPGLKHSGKTGPRGPGRGAQRNVIRSDKR